MALQQQVELLQAQQQQMLVQQQQFAQMSLQPGLLPSQPPMMPPSQLHPSYLPYGQFQQPQAPPSPHHRRAQSSMSASHHQHNYSNPPPIPSQSTNTSLTNQPGHARRHSLALSEAKKAAAIAQAKRSASPSAASSSTNTANAQNPLPSSPPNLSSTQIPSFKFPNSPERAESSSTQSGSASSPRSHARSQSLQIPTRRQQQQQQYRGTPPSNGFQFPASNTPQGSMDDFYRPNHQHQRSNSRNFDSNWRQPQQPPQQLPINESQPPSNQFIPGHRSGRSFNNNSTSSIQTFLYPPVPFGTPGVPHLQIPGGQQQPQRKSLFAPYLPQASLPGLLAEGKLVAGILRVNKKNRSDAYVSTDGLLDADIFICGSKDRNRALEGDLVAVELLEVDEVWGSKKEKEEKKKRKDAAEEARSANSSSPSSASPSSNTSSAGQPFTNESSTGGTLRRRGSLKQRPTQKKNDDVEVEGQSLLLVEEEALSDEIKPLYAGHVVAVIDRFPGQMFSGTLGLLRPSSQATKEKQDAERKGGHGRNHSSNNANDDSHTHNKPKIVWFKPTDKRVPLIAIPTEQAPKDFVENHEKYSDKIFVASIKRWPITSLHPFGTLVEILGSGEDINIEIEAIMRDNNFTEDVFPDSVKEALPSPEAEQLLTEEDLKSRRDFTSEYVIGFSPLEGLVEQAIHIRKISTSKVEIGFHVTDVTHFVSENSPIDNEAKRRGTSVFLKQKIMHMFPKEIIKYASFDAGRRSAALSVVFEIDPQSFEITDTWIGESFITPKHILSYESFAKVLNDEKIPDGVSQSEIDYIKTLDLVATMFRKQRLNMEVTNSPLPSLGLLNYVDDENVIVTSNIFDTNPVCQILGEISIKVNTAIAQKIYAVLGDRTFLRRHSDPILQKIEAFSDSVKNLNLEIDTTSSATILQCIFKIEDPVIRKGLEALFYKCMTRARYAISGKTEPENQAHYFLNVPLYTHFTSPLRRYADLVVHRQLRAVLLGKEYTNEIDDLVAIADSCTFKKDCAKNAQEQSIHLDVCQTIDRRASATGQLVIDSIIIQVYESAFDVLIPEYGIEKRVHGDQLPLRKAEFDKKTRLLELYWEGGIDSATYVPDDEKNAKSGPITRRRVRASSAASLLAQEQQTLNNNGQFDLSKLSLDDSSDKSLSKSSSTESAVTNGEKSTDGETLVNDNYEESGKILAPFFENVVTRVENGERVQEIRVLQHVPVLLRAELGKSIPCLTVRALNPFTK